MPAPQPRQRIRFDEPRWHVRNNALLRRRSSAKAPSEALSKRRRRDWASEARAKLLRVDGGGEAWEARGADFDASCGGARRQFEVGGVEIWNI